MKKLLNTETNKWPLIRFIAPAYPQVNIFSRSRITPLGLVNVATAANKLWGIKVEVVDENNYRGPRDCDGWPDHAALQRNEPAAVVGFYCGLTSTMERVFALARFYHDAGAITLAGGWHVHYCPEEALNHHLDIVAHGDGEIVIREILKRLRKNHDLEAIAGISFLGASGQVVTNPPPRLEIADLGQLPYPDFGLIKQAGKIKTYPVGRVRGCRMNCEFCSVLGKPRLADSAYVFGVISWLVETRKARRFFIVDDRLEEGKDGLLELLGMIREKYGDSLSFTVQVRLEAAKDTVLLEAMRRAGVRSVCIGYESPVDEDLRAMRKGLLAKDMVAWTRIMRRYFWVHGMFIFGYPAKIKNSLSVQEKIARFKKFIRQAGLSSIQVLHPVPLVGTALRARLEREGRLLPQTLVSWGKYDGSYACFIPDDMSIEELQEAPFKLMKWFYSPWSFLRIPCRTLLFPLHYLILGWQHWYRGWLRDIVRYGGHRLIREWQRKGQGKEFLAKLKDYVTKSPVNTPQA